MVSRGNRGTVRRALAAAFAIAAGAARATGEEARGHPWFVSSQAGLFGLHHSSGGGGGLRVGRDLSRHVSLDIGLGLAKPEGAHFASSDLGLTVRLCDPCPVPPFLVVDGGLLAEAKWEEPWVGPWVGGGAGLAVRINARDSLSVTVRAAVHDGFNGPAMVAAGWTHRFD